MTFVAVSDTIGPVILRLIELLVRDLMMPFWALLFVKNSMAGVWIREYSTCQKKNCSKNQSRLSNVLAVN